jgi:hypothetical protein
MIVKPALIITHFISPFICDSEQSISKLTLAFYFIGRTFYYTKEVGAGLRPLIAVLIAE